MKTTIITACTKNLVIGKEGRIPWNIPADLKFFKEVTLNHPVIMGRKTWESLPKKPLPERLNIVISKTLPQIKSDDLWIVNSLKAAIDAASYEDPNGEAFIMGGEQIYLQALQIPTLRKVIMSKIRKEYDGDTFFPILDPNVWLPFFIRQEEEFDIVEYHKL